MVIVMPLEGDIYLWLYNFQGGRPVIYIKISIFRSRFARSAFYLHKLSGGVIYVKVTFSLALRAKCILPNYVHKLSGSARRRYLLH